MSGQSVQRWHPLSDRSRCDTQPGQASLPCDFLPNTSRACPTAQLQAVRW